MTKLFETLTDHIIRIGEQMMGDAEEIRDAVDAAMMGGADPYGVRLEISAAIMERDKRRAELCVRDVPWEWVYRIDEEIRWLSQAQGRALMYQFRE